MKKTLSYKCKNDEEGRKLNQILIKQMELSPAEISRAKFRKNGILLNGVPAKVTLSVHEGDLISVCLEEEELASNQLIPLPGELTVLYEDEDLLAVYKPAGLVCHPVGGHYSDTLANIMQYYFKERGQQVVIRIVGRLDQETSGIVLAAKSQAAANRLNRQQEQGLLKKDYLALVAGCPEPEEGTVSEPIGPLDSIRMQVCPEGKAAVTHYRTLKKLADSTLLTLTLETGRTHQIRVHMAHLGHPLLGDQFYGNEKTSATRFARAALHAGRLSFLQPFTKEPIVLEAQLPCDFLNYLHSASKDESFSSEPHAIPSCATTQNPL